MSDNPSNFASTLANGIQDIAALLPLLGTEQCERHVGDALEKGFLYAAVVPLSIFGSLGIVKAAFAALLGTITYPFYGGRWLDDAGFNARGSVLSMVTITKSTGRYGAEIAVQKLLKEHNIEDPSLVRSFELSDGRRAKVSVSRGYSSSSAPGLGAQKNGDSLPASKRWMDLVYLLPWNVMLLLSSFLSASLSLTPYLYLMSNNWSQPLSWVFPLLRSFGSFLCVVVIQLALQLRIRQLANISLEWLKIQRKYRIEDEVDLVEQPVLEKRIYERLRLQPSSPPGFLRRTEGLSLDTERGQETSTLPLRLTEEEHYRMEKLFGLDKILALYQLALAIGSVMIVAGYVGCFSLVGQTKVKNAPYVWFGLEALFSILRILLWGLNPKWDEGTGLSISFELRDLQKSSMIDHFLHITSPYAGHNVDLAASIRATESELATIHCPERSRLPRHDHAMGRAIEALALQKSLYVTVYFTDSRPTLTFSANNSGLVFSSSFETNPMTRTVQVTILHQAFKDVDPFIGTHLYHQIVNHSRLLSTRLFGRQQIHRLAVKWNLLGLPLPSDCTHAVTSEMLTEFDQKYIALRKAWTAKAEYCKAREAVLEYLMNDVDWCQKYTWIDNPASFYGEAFFAVESLILELQLWHEETVLAGTIDDVLFSQEILPECVRALHLRVSDEHRKAAERCGRYTWAGSKIARKLSGHRNAVLSLLLQLRELPELQNTAHKIRQSIRELLSSHVDMYTMEQLGDYIHELLYTWHPSTLFRLWLNDCANVLLRMDVQDTPERKLFIMIQLSFFRLQRIVFSGLSIATSDTTLWNTFLDIPDHASWGTYVMALSTRKHCAFEPDGAFLRGISEITTETGRETLQRFLESDQLTTIVFNDLYGPVTRLGAVTLAEALDRLATSPNILYLAGMECEAPLEICRRARCQAAYANRLLWKGKMRGSGWAFAYRVGFESEREFDVQPKADHVRLVSSGRCTIMFFCPAAGEVKVTLHVCRRKLVPVELDARLVSDGNGQETRLPPFKIPVRQKKKDLERVTLVFSMVHWGTGRITVKAIPSGDVDWATHHTWKIYGPVEMEWIGAESDVRASRTESGSIWSR
ncbi:hypothetical protein VNI00_009271 [Paramarasmius palmivorus]|uniref:Uncharacterized protein n=1 Tax=Paramarasmius palmivorus TaxID=297713 RepID=A0AAW0CSI1_9AGAR